MELAVEDEKPVYKRQKTSQTGIIL